MRKFLIRGLVGGTLLLGGMLIGVVGGRLPVFASVNLFQTDTSPNISPGDYCHFYEITLANNLHVSTSALAQANADALRKTIDQLATDGKITAAEKSALEHALQKNGSDPCTNLPQSAADLMNSLLLKQQLARIHTTLVADVAKSLHLLPSTLEFELSQGKPLALIAQEQQIPLADANAAYLHSVKMILAQEVQKKNITQDQSNLLYTLEVQAVSGEHYPLLELK